MPLLKRSEETLADAQHHHSHAGERTLLRSIVSIAVLTLFAAVILIPFVYMVSISLKRPAEIGHARFMPDAVRHLFALRETKIVWLEARITSRETAMAASPRGIHAGPSTGEPWMRPKEALPLDATPAALLALDTGGVDDSVIHTLVEVQAGPSAFGSAGDGLIYFHDQETGLWHAVEATVAPRTLRSVAGRMFSNYRKLIDWDLLSSGQIIAWFSKGYPRWYVNSLFVAFATVILGVFFDSLAGFAFAKYAFPFRRPLFAILVATIMIPIPVTLVPTFFVFAKLGFYNTYAALIVPGMVSAFGIFLVRQYVQTIPDDMLSAARVDGASDFALYRHIVLPVARPVLAALAVFRFIWQWNTYLFPLVLTNKDSMKTVQLGLATMQDAYGTVDYGLQMAGATLAVLPILLVYAVMQKHFIHGITLGSVKG